MLKDTIRSFLLFCSIALLTLSTAQASETKQEIFSLFFDDLQEAQQESIEQNKKGIMLFFEMEVCPYCQRMRKTVLQDAKVMAYYRENFLAYAIDILGQVKLVDFEGKSTTYKQFSQKKHRVRSTPTIVFFDNEGSAIYRYAGAIQDPVMMQWLGEYVVAGMYQQYSFKDYQQKRRTSEL